MRPWGYEGEREEWSWAVEFLTQSWRLHTAAAHPFYTSAAAEGAERDTCAGWGRVDPLLMADSQVVNDTQNQSLAIPIQLGGVKTMGVGPTLSGGSGWKISMCLASIFTRAF